MIATLIRKLPKPVEFCLVVLVCFWWAIFTNSQVIARALSGTPNPAAQKQYTGIGVELGSKDNKVIIVQTLPNAPAAKAGIPSGAVVQKIDGIATEDKRLEDCAKMLGGMAGSKVTLELVEHDKTNTVELTRGIIQDSPKPHFTNRRAFIIIGVEWGGAAVMFWIARVRRWPLEAWGLRPSWKLTGAGILLWVVMTLVIVGISLLAYFISPGKVHEHFVSDVSLPVVIVFAITNGVYEETLE